MKNNLLFLFALISCHILQAQNQTTKKVFKDAERQVGLLLKETQINRSARLVFPRTIVRDSVKLVSSDDWTSGFFPGILWLLYEQTRDRKWKEKAEEYTALMVRELTNGNSHDVGFKVYSSYGNGYRLTGNNDYKTGLLQAARTLSKRFNPVVGSIRSWDFGRWQYPVIIDNMMNLELLFAATKISGDSSFYHIATAHANTTLKNHFRADHSSYHVVNYDTTTGKVMGKETHQGYAAESAWARGQAWALYGYTMCYRETKDTKYLEQAKGIAAFILKHPALPADKIPYWDFDVPDTNRASRDASAAAIMASALYQLSGFVKDGKYYRKAAGQIMESLTLRYRAARNTNRGFILLLSTGHKPANSEVDVPLIYADYYYLEALLRGK